ncbi:MAG: transcriptional regulator [Nitrososphaeria archaeon]|nr:helix-turn-helix domain-containing protein [Conexivisphaerales archaeon]
MKTVCEEVVRYVLPAYRSLIAKKLVNDYGLTQEEVSKIMGVSQAVVSYYVSNKRGKGVSKYENVELLQKEAEKSAERLAKGESSIKIAKEFCEICKALRENKLIKEEQLIVTCDK